MRKRWLPKIPCQIQRAEHRLRLRILRLQYARNATGESDSPSTAHVVHQLVATTHAGLKGIFGQPIESGTQVAISEAGFEERPMAVNRRKFRRQIQNDWRVDFCQDSQGAPPA